MSSVLKVEQLAIAAHGGEQPIVSGVSFELARGQVLGLVGESGSGKSLTCRAILGLLPPAFRVAGGSIAIGGRDIAGLNAREWRELRGTRISAVFQDPGSYLNPAIRVGKQIEEIFTVRKRLRRRAAHVEVCRLFEALQLRDPESLYQQYPHELSGGMQQRIMIAAAIALEPELLIADEATTALDVTVQAEIVDLVLELNERRGLALLVVAHDLALVAQLCDEVLVMRSGTIVERGSVDAILHRPQHAYTAQLIAEHETFGLERYASAPRRTGSDDGR